MSEEIINSAPEQEELSQEEVNSLKQIRIDKLNALKQKGADPFQITKFDVSSSNAQARAEYEAFEAQCKAQAGDDEEKLKELLEAGRKRIPCHRQA